MSLVVILMVGAILGWLASIVSRADLNHGVAINVAVGTAGAFVSGALAGGSSLLAGLTVSALAWTCLGALGLLAIVHLVGRSGQLRDRRR